MGGGALLGPKRLSLGTCTFEEGMTQDHGQSQYTIGMLQTGLTKGDFMPMAKDWAQELQLEDHRSDGMRV